MPMVYNDENNRVEFGVNVKQIRYGSKDDTAMVRVEIDTKVGHDISLSYNPKNCTFNMARLVAWIQNKLDSNAYVTASDIGNAMKQCVEDIDE